MQNHGKDIRKTKAVYRDDLFALSQKSYEIHITESEN